MNETAQQHNEFLQKKKKTSERNVSLCVTRKQEGTHHPPPTPLIKNNKTRVLWFCVSDNKEGGSVPDSPTLESDTKPINIIKSCIFIQRVLSPQFWCTCMAFMKAFRTTVCFSAILCHSGYHSNPIKTFCRCRLRSHLNVVLTLCPRY